MYFLGVILSEHLSKAGSLPTTRLHLCQDIHDLLALLHGWRRDGVREGAVGGARGVIQQEMKPIDLRALVLGRVTAHHRKIMLLAGEQPIERDLTLVPLGHVRLKIFRANLKQQESGHPRLGIG